MSDTPQDAATRREYGLGLSETRQEPPASRGLSLYVAALLLAPFVLIAGTVAWMAAPAYLHHAQYPYLANTGYAMRLQHADCDVVIYGDSTALVSVDPAVITAHTGLTACNLAEVAGVQRVNGLLALDTYLTHNRRPRFLIFLYAPENLVPASQWAQVSGFEGVFFRLQTKPDAAFWRAMLRHPTELTGDAELGLRTGVQWLLVKPLPPAQLHARERTHGWMPEPGATLTECPTDVLERAPDAPYLTSLRTTYGQGGTHVLIDAMPVPGCDPSRNFYAARLAPPLLDAPLATLPLADYTRTGRLHVNAAGAQAETEALAAQLAQAQEGAR